MDAIALRAQQAPLKDRYRADPEAAFITLKAHGVVDEKAIACKASRSTVRHSRTSWISC